VAAAGTAWLAIAIVDRAHAETSSWVTRAAPAETEKSVKQKPAAEPRAPAGASRKASGPTGEKTTRHAGDRAARAVEKAQRLTPADAKASKDRHAMATAVPTVGDDAAYIAYDQGQYLTALKLAQEAAGKGDPQAHTLIGRINAEGFGVPRDYAAAAKWYQRGAELGDVEAMFALAVLNAEGKGVAKDRIAAARLFEQAARQGHPAANYNLGLLFLRGDGKPENPIRAMQHLRYAAEKGVTAAQYDLGALYQKGAGTPPLIIQPDALEAATWIGKAARGGMPEAQFEYAVMLLRGQGLAADKDLAVPYLLAAARRDIAGAQNRLARLYELGIGVKKDLVEAAKWRLVARDQGLADPELDKLVARLSRSDRLAAEKAAFAWRQHDFAVE
jgi:TPR repeat protein